LGQTTPEVVGTKLRRFSELRSITGKTVLHC
jgi:hypothetical protein